MFYLVNSPLFWDKTTSEDSLPPLGQGYIATMLRKANVSVTLVDCVKEKIAATELIEKINKESPRYVGINIFTQNYQIVKNIAENININCTMFIGGQATKFLYKDIIKWEIKNTCIVIIGEGELIIPALYWGKCEQKPILKNDRIEVYHVNQNSKYYPEDISDISLDRTFFKDELMKNHYGQSEVAIITSRGCIFDCAFCGGARSLNTDIKPRIRSQKSIENEINQLLKIYPMVESVRVLDDLFLRSRESVKTAIDIFSKYPALSWRGMAHILSIKGATEYLDKLKESGCKELFIGIESGSPSIRKKINKNGSCLDVLNVAKCILNAGIDLKGYFILGFPDETEQDFRDTLNLALKIKEIAKNARGNFRSSVFQFRPYHGTKLYNELIERNIMVPECVANENISVRIGRSSFNFSSGNYSKETEDVLNKYIEAVQRLEDI